MGWDGMEKDMGTGITTTPAAAATQFFFVSSSRARVFRFPCREKRNSRSRSKQG